MELATSNSDYEVLRDAPSQCMAFRLGGQYYAVDILVVQELRRYSTPTALPDVPGYLSGVINLRGAVVPVLDLRIRFNLEPVLDRLTVIIVVAVRGKSVGLVVDAVTSVLNLSRDSVRKPPTLARHVDSSFIIGLAVQGELLVTLLDIGKLVAEEIGVP
jgi:purine-binding chemotaxis protein CheW